MIHGSATTDRNGTAEFLLRKELARGDVAHVRGMIGDVARQLLREETLGKLPSALLHDAPMALRAAGLKQQAVEEQVLALHPQATIPGGMDRLGANRAAAILVRSRDFTGN